MAKIYVASSWRNKYYPEVVEPELMYKLFDQVVGDLDSLVKCI